MLMISYLAIYQQEVNQSVSWWADACYRLRWCASLLLRKCIRIASVFPVESREPRLISLSGYMMISKGCHFSNFIHIPVSFFACSWAKVWASLMLPRTSSSIFSPKASFWDNNCEKIIKRGGGSNSAARFCFNFLVCKIPNCCCTGKDAFFRVFKCDGRLDKNFFRFAIVSRSSFLCCSNSSWSLQSSFL